MLYKTVKNVDMNFSEVTYIGFDEQNTTYSFKVFWESLQNARILPNPVSAYSVDGQAKVKDLPDEIKEKIYSAVKANVFSEKDVWERRYFAFHIIITIWQKKIGLITLFVVVLNTIIGLCG